MGYDCGAIQTRRLVVYPGDLSMSKRLVRRRNAQNLVHPADKYYAKIYHRKGF